MKKRLLALLLAGAMSVGLAACGNSGDEGSANTPAGGETTPVTDGTGEPSAEGKTVKVGMVSITPIIETIAKKMKAYVPSYLVVDPVMVATSGAYLLEETARRTLLEKLLPLASVITPNMMEGEVLSGMTIRSKDDMEKAAHAILDACGAAVLLKGGHLAQTADDYLLEKDGRGTWLLGRHIDNSNTHGTGCSLSSALASELALGHTLPEAAQLAKDYVALGIEHGLPVGHGHGPIHHFVSLYEKAGIGK